MKILKYPIELKDTNEIYMPVGAKILTIKLQYGVPTLWALCENTDEDELKTICIFGTGHPISSCLQLEYIDTFLMNDDTLVWHVFEKI